MRPKSVILLILALGCGLVASVGINQVMANRRGNTNEPAETVPVLVTLGEIGIGDPLKIEMLKVEEWPKNNVPSGALGKLEDIEGRVTRVRFYPGEPVLDAKLLGKGEKGTAASGHIPTGMRVVSVRVDAVSSSSGLILPGDRVDVLVHVTENQNKGIPQTSTRTFLQNVKVFAVDDLFNRNKDESAMAAKTISLLVTPKQAELVMLATQLGTLQLVMRSNTDETNSDAPGASVNQLLQHNDQFASRPAPVGPSGKNPLIQLLNQPPTKPEPQGQPRAGVFVMEVIEGGTVREVEFENEARAGKTVPGSTKKVDPIAGSNKKPQADEDDEEEPSADEDDSLVTPADE
ncbi:MAG: Flp pilus assembly protein CpaB [Pirellulales bacterium]